MQNANEKQNNTNPNDKYTPEEYLSETNIKNKEEAKRYLKELKTIFWVHLISLSFLYSSNESGNESAFVFFIFYICILGIFITSRRIPQPFKAGDECDTTLSEAKTWYNVVYEKNYL